MTAASAAGTAAGPDALTIAFVAQFHVVPVHARTGARVAAALEEAVDAVMTALLELEDDDEHGRHTDSASVSLETEGRRVGIELRAHGTSVENAEFHAWQTILRAIAASRGQVVEVSPVPDHLPAELAFEYLSRGSEVQYA